jgi:hypothetical protein
MRLARATAVALHIVAAAGCCGRRSTDPPASPPFASALLPDSAFNVRWEVLKAPSRLRQGQRDAVVVRVHNDGDAAWPDRATADPSADGRRAVRLAHRFIGPGPVDPSPFGTERTDLPRPLPAGDAVELSVPIVAPRGRGPHKLELALLQENVIWFSARGGATLLVPVTID